MHALFVFAETAPIWACTRAHSTAHSFARSRSLTSGLKCLKIQWDCVYACFVFGFIFVHFCLRILCVIRARVRYFYFVCRPTHDRKMDNCSYNIQATTTTTTTTPTTTQATAAAATAQATPTKWRRKKVERWNKHTANTHSHIKCADETAPFSPCTHSIWERVCFVYCHKTFIHAWHGVHACIHPACICLKMC